MIIRLPLLPLAAVFGLCLAGCNKPSDPNATQAKVETTADAAASPTSGPVPTGSDPADLRLKWKTGQRHQQRMEMTMKTETSGGPMPKPMKQDVIMNTESTLTTLAPRAGGGQELELQFGDIDMSVMMGGQEVMGFDSRGEALDNNPAAGIFRSMVGAKLKYLLNESNRVEKVEGWQELSQKVAAQAPGAARGMLAGVFNEEYFKQMADYGRSLPPGPVNKGQSWSAAQEITMGPLGKMVLDLDYIFKGWEPHNKQHSAAVTFTGTMTSKPAEGGAPGPFGKMNIEGGKVSGTYWFNPVAGMLVDTVMDLDLKMIMDLAGAGGPAPAGEAPTSMIITNVMKQKIQIKLTPEGMK